MLSKLSIRLNVLQHDLIFCLMRKFAKLLLTYYPEVKEVQYLHALAYDGVIEDLSRDFAKHGLVKSRILIMLNGNRYKEVKNKLDDRVDDIARAFGFSFKETERKWGN